MSEILFEQDKKLHLFNFQFKNKTFQSGPWHISPMSISLLKFFQWIKGRTFALALLNLMQISRNLLLFWKHKTGLRISVDKCAWSNKIHNTIQMLLLDVLLGNRHLHLQLLKFEFYIIKLSFSEFYFKVFYSKNLFK